MAQLADLAGRNLIVASQPLVEVGLEIRHIRDRPGYLREVLGTAAPAGSDAANEYTLSETFSTAAFGVGLVIGTNRRPAARSLNRSVLRTSEPDISVAAAGAGQRLFRGGAFPNPAFLYEGRAVLEGMVILDQSTHRPTIRQGKMLKQILYLVADMAYRKLQCPIIAIQSPAHVPSRAYSEMHTTGGEDEWSHSTALAVRFSLACGELGAQDRAAALQDLLEYCEDHGLGLSLLDPRPSHRSGNWFSLAQHRTPVRSRLPDQDIAAAYPLTFVGPARVGSTAAIASILSQIEDLPLLSCSIASLSDLAFISLQLGLDKQRYQGIVGDQDARVRLRDLPQRQAAAAVEEVLKTLGFARSAPHSMQAAMLARTGDYAACHGPLLKLGATSTSTHTRPIWFSVEGASGPNVLRRAVQTLYSSLRTVLARAEEIRGARLPNGIPVTVPNLEYLIARETHAGTLRARGKLAIPDPVLETLLPSQPNDLRAGSVCRAIEDVWENALASTRHAPLSVSVAWRENWLGHWLAASASPH
jgi:hypothetical protein